MSRSRTVKVAALVAAAAFGLAGCTDHPGAAAVVGSKTISDSRLQQVTKAACAELAGQQTVQQQDYSSRMARQGALSTLIQASLEEQYGRAHHIKADPNQVAQALSASSQSIAAIPKSRRAVYKQTLQDVIKGQLILVRAGQLSLQAAGTKVTSEQQALTQGQKLLAAWAGKHVHVTVNPRYGTYSHGRQTASSGSLSVPVSSRAAEGAKPSPDANTWVSALPADQKCS